ncbi:MAG: QueT transporter family protein [Candidatus Ranarchaeia archaeon]|jgi:uncharacterized membrane protein
MDCVILQHRNHSFQTVGGIRKQRALNLAITAVFGALYTALTILFAPISFLSFQVRISEVLIAFIPIFGWPVLVGITIGTFLGNTISPLGLIDMLIGTIATFAGGIGVLYIKQEILAFTFYAIVVSILVGWEIAFVFSLPLFLTIVEILVGELIAAGLGGFMMYSVAKKVFPTRPPIT